jgi:hypothetical protein
MFDSWKCVFLSFVDTVVLRF